MFRSTIWPVPGNSSPLESPIHGPFDKGRLGLASYMYLLSQKHGSWYPCLYFVLFVLGDHVHVRLGITWSLGLPTQRNLDLRRYPVNISIKYPHLVHFFCLGNPPQDPGIQVRVQPTQSHTPESTDRPWTNPNHSECHPAALPECRVVRGTAICQALSQLKLRLFSPSDLQSSCSSSVTQLSSSPSSCQSPSAW